MKVKEKNIDDLGLGLNNWVSCDMYWSCEDGRKQTFLGVKAIEIGSVLVIYNLRWCVLAVWNVKLIK